MSERSSCRLIVLAAAGAAASLAFMGELLAVLGFALGFSAGGLHVITTYMTRDPQHILDSE